MQRYADFAKKRVFWGEKGYDPEQSKDLETKIKTSRRTPKNTIQCQNPPTEIPNFGWRAAAAGLKPLAAKRSCAEKSTNKVLENRPAADAGRKNWKNWRSHDKKIGFKVKKDRKNDQVSFAKEHKKISGSFEKETQELSAGSRGALAPQPPCATGNQPRFWGARRRRALVQSCRAH